MDSFLNIASHIFIIGGLVFMFLGIIGIFRFNDFYPRILIASKIDTMGMISVLIGIMLRHGISFFTGKVLLILIITLVLTPLNSHMLARSAHQSGHGEQNNIDEEEQL